MLGILSVSDNIFQTIRSLSLIIKERQCTVTNIHPISNLLLKECNLYCVWTKRNQQKNPNYFFNGTSIQEFTYYPNLSSTGGLTLFVLGGCKCSLRVELSDLCFRGGGVKMGSWEGKPSHNLPLVCLNGNCFISGIKLADKQGQPATLYTGNIIVFRYYWMGGSRGFIGMGK